MITFFKYYGIPFKTFFGIYTVPILLLFCKNYIINFFFCLFNYFVVKILKKNIKNNDRPCKNIELKQFENWFQKKVLACADNGNIPSGHASIGVILGFLYFKKSGIIYKIFSFYFFSLGITRYYALQHDINAILIGYFVGIINILISNQYKKNLIKIDV